MSNITVRRFAVDFTGGFARHWLGGDPYLTHLFNALSASFEQGERLFCRSLRAVRGGVLPGDLAAEVRSLLGQEGEHLRVHRQFNAELVRQGFPYDRELKWTRWTNGVDARPLVTRVAITAAFEHFTAGLSHGVLYFPEWMGDADEPLRTCWQLHAGEELEHSSVAFDVYQAIGGNYHTRVLWMLRIAFVFARETGLQTWLNLRRDGELYKWRTVRSAARMWLGRHGIAWLVFASLVRYLSPRFHPSRYIDAEKNARWLSAHSASFVVASPATAGRKGPPRTP